MRTTIIAAVQAARRVLGEYIAPGPRDAVDTVDLNSWTTRKSKRP